MVLKGKTILFISPEAWGTNFVSKHHYAIELANRGNKVYFLNPPTDKLNVNQYGNRIYIIDYSKRYLGLRFFPRIISSILIKREIESLECKLKVDFDVIWNFENSRFFNLNNFSGLSISHIVDSSQKFNFKIATKTHNLALGVTESIVNQQKLYNKNSFKIQHGFSPSTINPVKLNQKFKIHVGYVGNMLSRYIDWDILKLLFLTYTDICFNLIGPYDESNLSGSTQTNLLGLKDNFSNVLFWGQVPSNKILSCIANMDVMILVYLSKKYPIQLSNSHKILEYMAVGKVTVSTWIEEYRDKRDLLEMVEDSDSFQSKFDEVISNLTFHNSTEKQKMRINWAMANTYHQQVHRIENIIKNID